MPVSKSALLAGQGELGLDSGRRHLIKEAVGDVSTELLNTDVQAMWKHPADAGMRQVLADGLGWAECLVQVGEVTGGVRSEIR